MQLTVSVDAIFSANLHNYGAVRCKELIKFFVREFHQETVYKPMIILEPLVLNAGVICCIIVHGLFSLFLFKRDIKQFKITESLARKNCKLMLTRISICRGSPVGAPCCKAVHASSIT